MKRKERGAKRRGGGGEMREWERSENVAPKAGEGFQVCAMQICLRLYFSAPPRCPAGGGQNRPCTLEHFSSKGRGDHLVRIVSSICIGVDLDYAVSLP